MTNLLLGLGGACLLSLSSLLAVLFSVSPLTAPDQALPTFFLSTFLSVSTVSALLLTIFWQAFHLHQWDTGTLLSTSLREGGLLGLATTTILLFHILALLTWVTGFLTLLIIVLLEIALFDPGKHN